MSWLKIFGSKKHVSKVSLSSNQKGIATITQSSQCAGMCRCL